MSPVEDVAQELAKIRAVAQTVEYPRDKAAAYAECLFLDMYGRLPSLLDLRREGRKRVTLVPTDDDGRKIRVITRDQSPIRVYKRHLDVDIYVFIKTGRTPTMTSILGWLPIRSVVQMPIVQFPADEHRQWADFCHETDREFMIKMPDTFSFNEDEHHSKDAWHGIWAYDYMAWECLSCGRLIPDEVTRRRAEKELNDS